MRDGRRQRLGLVDGTDGTVQDTYLDRILSDVDVAGEPNILSLDPDANVRTTDQRYLQDAYNYYLGGGPDAAQDDFPIQADDFTGGGGGGGDNQALATSGVGTGGDPRPSQPPFGLCHRGLLHRARQPPAALRIPQGRLRVCPSWCRGR